jgi:hypothetical protein
VDELEPGWPPGDTIYVELPDGQTVRYRIVTVLDDGTVRENVPRACRLLRARPRRSGRSALCTLVAVTMASPDRPTCAATRWKHRHRPSRSMS